MSTSHWDETRAAESATDSNSSSDPNAPPAAGDLAPPAPPLPPAVSPAPPPILSPPRLAAIALSVHFGQRSALEGIDARFERGETVSLLGPNGAGKTTLLKALAGILPPTHGEVRLDGRPVHRPDRHVVYVPQRTGVDWSFPISVLDVALMGRGLVRSRFRPLASADRADGLAALDQVGMRRLAHIQIGQLSGGQQQRAFLARALVQAGDVYLLDEPFVGVDVPTQELLVALFRRLCTEGKTIIYATHDLAQAAASSDRILLLRRRLIAEGPPQSTMTAANLQATYGGQAILPFAVERAG